MRTARCCRLFPRLIALVFALVLQGPAALTADQKLQPRDLVGKHLESIGSADARAAAGNRAVAGDSRVTMMLGGAGELSGKGNMMSEGRSVRLGMRYNALEYPGEQLAYDGSRVTVGQIRPGVRSRLSEFVFLYSDLLEEGLLGGTLSTAWPLLDIEGRQPKLQYAGLKKVDSRQMHELRYKAKKGGGELQISLFFDAETFRHLRTQYRLIIPEDMAGRPEDSSRQSETRHELIETFDDFKPVDSLTLPHAYKLHYTVSGGQGGGYMAAWTLTVTQLAHNQQMDPKYFRAQ